MRQDCRVLLACDGLGKSYGAKTVLRDVTLGFEAGGVTAVLGMNGAGKTTLLGCLAGVLGWSRGEVRIDGRRLDRRDIAQRRRLLLMPDAGLVFDPGADLIRNAAIFSELWRGVDAPAPPDFHGWLERFDLADVALEPLAGLSRGQVYKASLVAAMAADPAIWLLDEPFASGMDPRGMDAFRRLVRGAADRGACVIYTSQFPELAVRFADRIVVIGGSSVASDLATAGVPGDELERSLEITLGIRRESP